MKKQLFRLVHSQARKGAISAIESAPDGYIVMIDEPRRSLEANAVQWPILQAFADQLQWPINGRLEWLTPEEWKDLLTAAFKREVVRVAPGLDGGMVMLGARTSKFSKHQFSEWIDFLRATAAQRDIQLDYMEYA